MAAAALPLVAACELTEVELAEPDDVVVVEAYVRVPAPGPFAPAPELTAFLHRTLEVDAATDDPPPAVVVVRRPSDGRAWPLLPAELRECLVNHPVIVAGSCYRAEAVASSAVLPGDTLVLEVALEDGRTATSTAVVPGDFDWVEVEASPCGLEPRTPTELRWTRAEGTWAYLVEALVGGLRPHFEVEVDDPLYLLGLAISAADTTLVFPGEMGLFARGELERPVALYLQEGLPPGTTAAVTVAAAERNWVNWARGGSFNPSGQVRVPSVRGEGVTGVFGAAGVRRLEVAVPESGRPPHVPCPPPPRESP